MSKLLILDIFCALIADAAWGLAYVIPNLLPDYTAVEITFGRYFNIELCIIKWIHGYV